jgi:hypothetical protein
MKTWVRKQSGTVLVVHADLRHARIGEEETTGNNNEINADIGKHGG